MNGRVQDKVAIVTGGNGGIGRAIGKLFAAEGATVYLTDIRRDENFDVATEISSSAAFLNHDVADYEQWLSVVAVAEQSGPVSVLVNCAGIGSPVSTADTSPEDFRRVLDVNLTGVFLGIKAVEPSMRRADRGSIVNISSIAGLVGLPGLPAYVASKFGVRGLTKSAAAELAPHIRVNSVHPGAVNTPLLDTDPAFGGLASVVDQFPLGRMAESEEIAPLVLYLASDESSYSTGSEFVADGGWTCV
jgi:3alpha(or 20beta)-hydroxysteroid dehydrogenase